MSANAGNFFPPEYKQFPFKEGDLLSSRSGNGKHSVSKIIKIDKVVLKKGEAIGIQGQTFVATEDDYLLVVSALYSKAEFDTFEQAREAARSDKWRMETFHIPNRTPGAAEGQQLVGHAPVTERDLGGYRLWKADFEKGKAGIF